MSTVPFWQDYVAGGPMTYRRRGLGKGKSSKGDHLLGSSWDAGEKTQAKVIICLGLLTSTPLIMGCKNGYP
jgi:hypothetical protein